MNKKPKVKTTWKDTKYWNTWTTNDKYRLWSKIWCFCILKSIDKQLLNTWICCDKKNNQIWSWGTAENIYVTHRAPIGQGQHQKLIDARLLPHSDPTEQLNRSQLSFSWSVGGHKWQYNNLPVHPTTRPLTQPHAQLENSNERFLSYVGANVTTYRIQ